MGKKETNRERIDRFNVGITKTIDIGILRRQIRKRE
jgi:hypothetical protein